MKRFLRILFPVLILFSLWLIENMIDIYFLNEQITPKNICVGVLPSKVLVWHLISFLIILTTAIIFITWFEKHTLSKAPLKLKDKEILGLLESYPLASYYKKSGSSSFFCNSKLCQQFSLKCSLDSMRSGNCLTSIERDLLQKDDSLLLNEKAPRLQIEELPAPSQSKWIQILKTPLFDTKQNLLGILGFVWDVTKDKTLLKELEFIQFSIDRASYMVFWVTKFGDIIYVNDLVCKTYGYTREQFLKMNVSQFDMDFNKEAIQEIVPKIIEQKTITIESTQKRADGSTFPSRNFLNYFNFQNKEYMIGFMQDISEEVQHKSQVEMLNDQLKLKNQQLESMIYATNHDLRSPLVNIQGFATEIKFSLKEQGEICQELKSLFPPDKQQQIHRIKSDMDDSINYIVSSVSKMDQLLKGLVEICRLGTMQYNPEQLDMNKFIKFVQETLQYNLTDKNIALNIDPLPPCYADSSKLTTVFTNLIDNAIKYRRDDIDCKIKISASAKKDTITYCIHDNGPGIPKKSLTKIFNVLSRVDNRTEIKGDGLGLSIVRKIVEMMNGKVWAESDQATGTAFFIQLPAAIPDLSPDNETD